ncbi:MAG: hypothetical protein NVS4B7_14010 [Ktedonobacteraceae bacterium]
MEQSDIELLHTVPPYHLQSLVKMRHIPSSSSVPEIAQYLFEPVTIAEAIRSLNDTEATILRELVACGGRANSRDLALYLSSSKAFNSGKETEVTGMREYSGSLYPTPHPHGIFEQSLRRLLMLGLLFWGKQTNFAGRDYTSGVYDGVLILPQAVKDVVNDVVRKEKNPFAAHDSPAQMEIVGGMRAFQRMLYLYWAHVSALHEGLPLINTGLLSRSALRQVIDLLGPKGRSEQIRTEQDAPRLLFIRLLLMKLGLLQEYKGAIHAAPADDFFALPLVERARHCYRLWLDTPFWNELAYLPDVLVRPGPNPLDPAHEEAVRARQMLIERVLVEPSATWLEVSAFIARTKLYTPYLLFPRQYGPRAERYSMNSNPYGWDFRLRHGWLTHREGWHLVEGGFIRAVVLGPLLWLGIVEVKPESTPTAFCLASTASLVTSNTLLAVEDPPWGRLIVQPNFELVALAPVSEVLLVKLDRFAERLSLEHIAQYRLTKASITRAIQSGLHAEAIQQILVDAASGELPQNVRYSLGEWERQACRIEVWQAATLLEVNDTALLDTLFADEKTRPLLGRRLSPTLAEVASHQLPTIQAILWQRNYLPALTSTPERDSLLENGHVATCEPQWRLHNDGLLQPLYIVTDLYLAASIARITETDQSTGWRRITASTIQHATTTGISLDAIIRFLQQYCQESIPASFLIRLKLWGNGYGKQSTIHVEQSPLLYLSSEVLQDIQTDEDLQHLLGSEVSQEGRLVRVPPEKLAQVVDLLRKRGFEVE